MHSPNHHVTPYPTKIDMYNLNKSFILNGNFKRWKWRAPSHCHLNKLNYTERQSVWSVVTKQWQVKRQQSSISRSCHRKLRRNGVASHMGKSWTASRTLAEDQARKKPQSEVGIKEKELNFWWLHENRQGLSPITR